MPQSAHVSATDHSLHAIVRALLNAIEENCAGEPLPGTAFHAEYSAAKSALDAPSPTPAFASGKRYLITTDNWFHAPDGNSYRGVWGTAAVHHAQDLLGFKPANSANWFVTVGGGDGALMVMGCQIHYVAACETQPTNREIFCIRSAP